MHRDAVMKPACNPIEAYSPYDIQVDRCQFENGERIGKVVEVMDYPSVECLKIERPEGFLEVPMLPQWLDRLDVQAGEVHLKTLEDIPLQRR